MLISVMMLMPKHFQFVLADEDAEKLELLIGSETKQLFFERYMRKLVAELEVQKNGGQA